MQSRILIEAPREPRLSWKTISTFDTFRAKGLILLYGLLAPILKHLFKYYFNPPSPLRGLSVAAPVEAGPRPDGRPRRDKRRTSDLVVV